MAQTHAVQIVIFGAGAVGSVIGGRLSQHAGVHGHLVTLLGRGAHLRAGTHEPELPERANQLGVCVFETSDAHGQAGETANAVPNIEHTHVVTSQKVVNLGYQMAYMYPDPELRTG